MSRLESVIRRLQAQVACLNEAAALVEDLPGPVLELGLGNGRTYDHLRERMPDREIFVFDRQVNAHPDCIPDPGHLFLGDVTATLPAAAARIGRPAALVHLDIGTGDAVATAALVAGLATQLRAMMAEGGVLASDQALTVPGLHPLPLPEEVPERRYFLYRAA